MLNNKYATVLSIIAILCLCTYIDIQLIYKQYLKRFRIPWTPYIIYF